MSEATFWRDAPEAEYAVIGDPVGHSRSPRMHQAAYDELGLPFRYVALHVPPGEVAAALNLLSLRGYRGVNVTVPHKEEALEWCSVVEPLARKVRAVNTIRLEDHAGMNTDAPGFLETLADRGVEPGAALVLGAGGSARALVFALAREGWSIRVFNRTRSRAVEMIEGLGIEAEIVEAPDPAEAHLVLNTTSASLQGDALALDWSRARPDALAYDLMYTEGPTPFLAQAAAAGLRICDGRPLLVAQGALAFEWWLGVPAPREAMARAIR
ncbi:MAG: shikimate dehydrogenase [Fimbriimonas sp.]